MSSAAKGMATGTTTIEGKVIALDDARRARHRPTASDAAAEAFVKGWVTEMKNKGWTPALYGSSSGSAMYDMYELGSTYRPTDADLADYSHAWNSPWDIYQVPNSAWEYDHRIHQYNADSSCETWGGICLKVDRNCAIGPTAKAWSFSIEGSEPSGSSESDGPSEDVPPCN